ncbi:MAG: MFS transporter, partial [Solirubrobacteraceae bacterium]
LLGCALLALAPARRAIARVPLHWLVGVQLYRVVGGLFLIAYLQDDMPAQFALPAGIGDVLVGIAAPFVAVRLARDGAERARPAVAAWCTLGILDLAVAVTCGFLTAPGAFQQLALDEPNAAITSYPLVLIPTFAVPVSFVLHVYVLARLRTHPRAAARPRTA